MKVSGKNKSCTIKNPEDLKRIQLYLKINNYRAYILFTIALATGYRGSDLVKLTISDLKQAIKTKELNILEQKTENTRNKQFVRRALISDKLVNILKEFVIGKDDCEYVYPSQKGKGKGKYKQHIRRDTLGKEFKKAVIECGVDCDIVGTHTPRKTYGYFQYLKHGKDINVVMELFGHSSQRVTKAYIGIDDDLLIESAKVMDCYI